MRILGVEYKNGWYEEEQDELGSFRWMNQEAHLNIKGINVPGKKYLQLIAGHSFPSKEYPTLKIYLNGHLSLKRAIQDEFSSYFIPFEDVGDIWIELVLDGVFKIPEDSRDLGIIVRKIELITLNEENFLYGEGWHGWEDGKSFRWTPKRAQLLISSKLLKGTKYISFFANSKYSNFSQKLTVFYEGKLISKIPLFHKWNYYCCSLLSDKWEKKEEETKKEGVRELVFLLNKLIPDNVQKKDTRELGIKVKNIVFHNDKNSFEEFQYFHKNALLNHEEMLEGKVKLESFPRYLGIDLYGKCNIKPPCVYCEWDLMKKSEGKNINVVVDEKTLENYGPFFKAARNLVNCSIGEPLLHPRLKQILDLSERQKKTLEMATNAQALTEEIIQVLVGKRIELYVSLDASCKETYSRIRNDNWDSIITNLTLLNKVRKKSGKLPHIHLVFMPMHVNKNDLEGYFQLCQQIEADTLTLRPLNFNFFRHAEVERGGYCFNYQNELLSKEELKEIFKLCENFSKKYKVIVGNQFNFGADFE